MFNYLQTIFMNTKSPEFKIMLFAVTLIATIIIFVACWKKYKLNKYQISLFVMTVSFWSAINMVRSFNKSIATSLDFSSDQVWWVLAAYGLLSIFLRFPVFWASDYLKSRKIFIQGSMGLIGLTGLLFYFDPKFYALFLSALMLGLGASIWPMLSVMFSETFKKEDAVISVALLSIAPLLSEFFVAPIQTIEIARAADAGVSISRLWIYSAICALITLTVLFFIKDNKEKTRNITMEKFKRVISSKEFWLVAIMGLMSTFFRFGTSGNHIISYGEEVNMGPIFKGYIDLMFTAFQLIAGLSMGFFLRKKIGNKGVLMLGFLSTGIGVLMSGFIATPLALFIGNGLNGLGYGFSYNVLLNMVLEPYEKDMRETTMGLYQTVLAFGVYFGPTFVQSMLTYVKASYENPYGFVYKLVGILAVLTVIVLGFIMKNDVKKEA